MHFSKKEKEIIKQWFEHIARDSLHYGNGEALFPQEAFLLKKLEQNQEEIEFTRLELIMIADWMQKNIRAKYGDSEYLLGEEKSLYEKLKPYL